jgi:excisionase family DNA binding protein
MGDIFFIWKSIPRMHNTRFSNGTAYPLTVRGVTMRTLKIATEDRLHSAESAAELLGVRPSTIRWWWTIGNLHRVKIGRLTRVRESELLAMIKPDIRTEGR